MLLHSLKAAAGPPMLHSWQTWRVTVVRRDQDGGPSLFVTSLAGGRDPPQGSWPPSLKTTAALGSALLHTVHVLTPLQFPKTSCLCQESSLRFLSEVYRDLEIKKFENYCSTLILPYDFTELYWRGRKNTELLVFHFTYSSQITETKQQAGLRLLQTVHSCNIGLYVYARS